jgi:hypothetical protein
VEQVGEHWFVCFAKKIKPRPVVDVVVATSTQDSNESLQCFAVLYQGECVTPFEFIGHRGESWVI